MTLFDDFIDDILAKEGGYVNDPRDSGGETNYGITVAVARANGYNGPMKTIPLSLVKLIYKKKYWDVLRLDDLQNLCPALCMKMADIAVNMGPTQAAFFLQRILNVMNNQGKLYPDIKADGKVGPATIGALKSYLRIRGHNDGETVLIRAMNCLQGVFYISLAERRQKDEAFMFGWFKRIIA